jgi:thymidylate synthase
LNESNGNTNQASITVGDTEVCQLSDPPCLRNISFKVVDGQLQMSVYFRSWDLYAGLPENLGGLQLLKEYVLSHLLFPVIDGPLIAYSDGLHLYSQYFDCADTLNATKVTVDASALADKELYEMENGK